MLKRLVRALLRSEIAYRVWCVESRLRYWAFRGIPDPAPWSVEMNSDAVAGALDSLKVGGYAVLPVTVSFEMFPTPNPASRIDPADVYGLHV